MALVCMQTQTPQSSLQLRPLNTAADCRPFEPVGVEQDELTVEKIKKLREIAERDQNVLDLWLEQRGNQAQFMTPTYPSILVFVKLYDPATSTIKVQQVLMCCAFSQAEC